MVPRTALAITVILLLAGGTAVWAIRHEGTYALVQNRLHAFPVRLLGYQGYDEQLQDSVYAVLGNDHNLLRKYTDGAGRTISLYVGYYGTAKGGRPAHVPQSCYTGQGFSIDNWWQVAVPGGRPGDRIDRMIVKRGHERQLVLFWIQSHGDRIPKNGIDLNLLSLRTRLVGARDDGSLVRVSIPIEAYGDESAERELSRFAAEVIRLLPVYWPLEARVQT
jgi:EpsI family protein